MWYLYALVITASYAGEIRSFFINPGTTSPLDNLRQVVDSNLGWGLILYGEEEEKVMATSQDPIISKLWEVCKIFVKRSANNMLIYRIEKGGSTS